MTHVFQIEVRDSLAKVPASDWNALEADGNPFLRHEFLFGLEASGCLSKSTGWYPRYFLLRRLPVKQNDADNPDNQDSVNDTLDGDDAIDQDSLNDPEAGELVGAVPAYLKTNSYGEFVFDWAWADAYQRHGLEYYPKLVAAIPFTPATGRRLLVRNDQPYADTLRLLAAAVRQFAGSEDCSGAHYLFLTEAESDVLSAVDPLSANDPTAEANDHLRRLDCQYHWHNNGYATFDAFLADCTSKRRKTIRRERRHVSDAGLSVERRMGASLSADEWEVVHSLYCSTYDRKWGNPSLTLKFFRRMGETFGDNTLIVLVHDPDDAEPERAVACSIMFLGGGTLYGRYWGCRREYNSLHFEACYYQGIEHCIENGIAHFEPGAQGEHKITRGFVPTLTRSAHWIAHPQFRDAIGRFLGEEMPHVEQRCAGLAELLPFKAEKLLP